MSIKRKFSYRDYYQKQIVLKSWKTFSNSLQFPSFREVSRMKLKLLIQLQSMTQKKPQTAAMVSSAKVRLPRSQVHPKKTR